MIGLGTLTALATPSRLWLAGGVALAAFLIASTGYGFGYGSGRAKGAKQLDAYKVEAHEREMDQEQALSAANERNREREATHERAISDLRAEYAATQADAKATDDRRIADLRAGTERLRLKVANCRAAKPGTPATATGGTDDTGTADLTPETASALWSIAADGDRAIRKLTALQSWAQSAVSLSAGEGNR